MVFTNFLESIDIEKYFGTTNQKAPSQGMSFVFPPYGNFGPFFMDTLNLPGLTIGLQVWLFSSPVIPSALIVSNPNSPSQEHQHHVDISPSSLDVSSSLSPSFPIETCDASNQVDKKKKKKDK